MTNIYIALVLLVAYIVILCYRNATIPSSLANSFFRLAPVGKWLMVAVVTTTAVLTVPELMDSIWPSLWPFAKIMIGSMSLVISIICVLLDLKIGHKFFTITFYVCTQLYVAPCLWLFAISWVPWLFWFIWITKDRPWRTQAFWAEITCIANFFSYTIYQILLE